MEVKISERELYTQNCENAMFLKNTATKVRTVEDRQIGLPCYCGCFNNLGLNKINFIKILRCILEGWRPQLTKRAFIVQSNDMKRTLVKEKPRKSIIIFALVRNLFIFIDIQ